MIKKFQFSKEDISNAEKSIQAKVKEIIREPELLNQIGEVVIQDIKRIARTGKDPKTGQRFKTLSPQWIREREKIEKVTPTHETYRANRSNITITGQLLDSMTKRIVNGIRSASLLIYFAGIHRPYQALRRNGIKRVGKPISNDKLSGYVNEIRPFFYLRDKLQERLKTIVIRFIRRKL